MKGFVTSFVAAVALAGCSTQGSLSDPGRATAPAGGGVRVELADTMSATARSKFERADGRELVAAAVGRALAGRENLAACGEGLAVTVTDYRLTQVPWSGTGRAARPYRVRQQDVIRATVTVPEADVGTFTVEARASGAKTTRLDFRIDRLAKSLANAVTETVARDIAGKC